MPERREEVFWIVGPRRRARLRLRGSFFVVGRLEPFPIFLDDPTISREHAAVVACPEGVRVRDLGSKNGVLVNGKRLDRYAEVGISPGDVLRVGNTELRLLREGEDPTTAAAVTDEPSDEHAVDDAGQTRAIRLGTPAPAAPSLADPASSSSSSDVEAPSDPEDLEGDATCELDVPQLPGDPATPSSSPDPSSIAAGEAGASPVDGEAPGPAPAPPADPTTSPAPRDPAASGARREPTTLTDSNAPAAIPGAPLAEIETEASERDEPLLE